jgi:riboflavin transporter FmnP
VKGQFKVPTIINAQTLSGAAVFGALSAVMSFFPYLRFPLLPYLRFELAEIPIMIGTFIYGPIPGIISSIAYWIILNFIGEFQPYGPLMKFLSVLGMIMGAWGFQVIIKKLGLNLSPRYAYSLMLSMAALVRIIFMTALNYVMLWILLPEFLGFASTSLSTFLGISFQSNMDALMVIMIVTAVFNLIHTILSGASAYGIVRIVFYKRSLLKIRTPWLSTLVRNSERSY